MTRNRLAALVAATALVSTSVAASGVAAPAERGAPATQEITGKGVGLVKLKKGYAKARRQGLIGKIRPGCELGGPRTRSAKLKSPLRGQVDFTLRSPRRIANITITRGAAARGVGIGATIPEIEEAFPNAVVDRDTEEVFGVTLVTIPKRDGGRFQYAVDTGSGKTTIIGIPGVAFCE